jgi:hypothetical protein
MKTKETADKDNWRQKTNKPATGSAGRLATNA